ncbi:MAG: MarR family winged helix-turn-helix transcriptional regulator [Longibaculum sp.]
MNSELLVELYKVSSAMISSLNNQLRPYHLTFQQFLILDYLSRKEDTIIGKDICQYLGISHPTSVGLMTRMRGKGFITMDISESDRRQTEIALTDEGYNVLKETQILVEDMEKKMSEQLQSKSMFLEELKFMKENIK